MELLSALLQVTIILGFIYFIQNASNKRIDSIRKDQEERSEKILSVLIEIRDLLKKA
ncbi:MAG: hypothetical protein H6753_06770 [Candidatus Omnitrophica bacterium]|nr:hypothetical protein [Candidatus Omnitrophota bacterium]